MWEQAGRRSGISLIYSPQPVYAIYTSGWYGKTHQVPRWSPLWRHVIGQRSHLFAHCWILAKGLGVSSKLGLSAGVSLVKGTAAKEMHTHWEASVCNDNWLSRSLRRAISQCHDGTLSESSPLHQAVTEVQSESSSMLGEVCRER